VQYLALDQQGETLVEPPRSAEFPSTSKKTLYNVIVILGVSMLHHRQGNRQMPFGAIEPLAPLEDKALVSARESAFLHPLEIDVPG